MFALLRRIRERVSSEQQCDENGDIYLRFDVGTWGRGLDLYEKSSRKAIDSENGADNGV